MKLFVTGATGFVGSHFVNAALAGGHEVIALRRSRDSVPRIALDAQPKWLDASMEEVTAEHLKGVDAVVHLAAHTANVPYDSIENCLHWNVNVPLKLFRKALAAGVDRLVVAGSCFEYGAAGERYEFIPTNAPLEATLSYPLSKAVASRVFTALAAETGARISIHRIFQVFGPGESEHRLWPSLKRAALAGEDFASTAGEQVRDFIPVQQVASHLLGTCGRSTVPGQAFVDHIGSGQPQTVREFIQHWWQRWNAKGKVQFGGNSLSPGRGFPICPTGRIPFAGDCANRLDDALSNNVRPCHRRISRLTESL